MRREDAVWWQKSQPCLVLRQYVQRIRIQNKRNVHFVKDVFKQGDRLSVSADAGAYGDGVDVML